MQLQKDFKENTKTSAEFRKQATKAILSICGFALVYIFILIFSIALSVACVACGVALIVATRPHWLIIVMAIGLASLGVIITIFVLKFLFRSRKVDRSHLIEVSRDVEPQLFDFIQRIVDEVGTKFPKRVYLSHEVNACVFYDSGFWSMFFPVRKNLEIGMGLVNTLTEAELKAILAHEFGHFSQKSMRVGSYVYNVNRVIHNLLFENESFDKLTQRWAEFSRYFTVFVGLAVRFTEGIKWIMRKMYEVVNRRHLALSREMEFHADQIAAWVAGSEAVSSALLRLDFADSSFTSVLDFYNGRSAENLKSENLYREQHFVMNFNAERQKIPLRNNFPDVTTSELFRFNKSKLEIRNQWASHPEIKERVERVNSYGFESRSAAAGPANAIFQNAAMYQKQFSELIFQGSESTDEYSELSFDEFTAGYKQQVLNNSFSELYNGFYDHRNPLISDLDSRRSSNSVFSADDLFSDQNVALVYSGIALQNDIETLKQISSKAISLKTFDYDGKKFNASQSEELQQQLEKELSAINEQLTQLDTDSCFYFAGKEKLHENKESLLRLYQEFYEFDRKFDDLLETQTEIRKKLEFIHVSTANEQIQANFTAVQPLILKLKEGVAKVLQDGRFLTAFPNDFRVNMEAHASERLIYFEVDHYIDENLSKLFECLGMSGFLMSRAYLHLKKQLLDYQAGLLLKSEAAGDEMIPEAETIAAAE